MMVTKQAACGVACKIYAATSPPSSLVLPTDDEEVTDATYTTAWPAQ
jgi:hypothetical protein